jgi:hypothetical protein
VPYVHFISWSLPVRLTLSCQAHPRHSCLLSEAALSDAALTGQVLSDDNEAGQMCRDAPSFHVMQYRTASHLHQSITPLPTRENAASAASARLSRFSWDASCKRDLGMQEPQASQVCFMSVPNAPARYPPHQLQILLTSKVSSSPATYPPHRFIRTIDKRHGQSPACQ